MVFTKLIKTIEELKKSNEELKTALAEAKSEISNQNKEILRLNGLINEDKSVIISMRDEIGDLKKAIKEIREVSESSADDDLPSDPKEQYAKWAESQR